MQDQIHFLDGSQIFEGGTLSDILDETFRCGLYQDVIVGGKKYTSKTIWGLGKKAERRLYRLCKTDEGKYFLVTTADPSPEAGAAALISPLSGAAVSYRPLSSKESADLLVALLRSPAGS